MPVGELLCAAKRRLQRGRCNQKPQPERWQHDLGEGSDVHHPATAVEALGQRPLLVQGGTQNFKVTYPDDFALAEAVLKGRVR